MSDSHVCRIGPCSARAETLQVGDELVIIDPEGEQVSDFVAYSLEDTREYLSSGRTIDYAARLWITTGDTLYSNRSRPMLEIVDDTCGRHDFTLTPCSKETFSIIYGETENRPGCEGNLVQALEPWDIGVDRIPIAFNVFMHVHYDPHSGAMSVRPPSSKAGDSIRMRALMPLVVAMTACSAGQSNNFRYKPIDYRIQRAGASGVS